MAGELEDIGTRLREERDRVQISQRELARRIGLSASMISQIESGQSKPSVSTLYAIVTELGVSVDDIFSGGNGSAAEAGDDRAEPGVIDVLAAAAARSSRFQRQSERRIQAAPTASAEGPCEP